MGDVKAELRLAGPDSPDLLTLIDALDADLERRYPALSMAGVPDPHQGLSFVIAYLDDRPVACGGMRQLDAHTGELKRMFVLPAARRCGIARQILGFLEAEALRRGYSRLLLESGVRQPEALALYESCGFSRIPLFGEYVGGKLNVCYEKQLEPDV